MRKSRPFLLLELVIGITLLILCMPLFIKDPLLLLNKEISSLEKIELQRIAENCFVNIKAKLYQNSLEWEKFSSPSKKKSPFIENSTPITIAFPHSFSKSYKEKYRVWAIKEKQEENSKKIARRVGIEIVLTPLKKGGLKTPIIFLYEVFALSLPKEKPLAVEPDRLT